MKHRIRKTVMTFIAIFFALNLMSQKEKLTVLNIDSQGIDLTPQQLGNLARIEVEKLGLYEVMDRYDVAYMIKKHKLDIEGCYGKICLVEMGNVIKTDKMLSGSVETYGEKLILTLRLIDVKSEKIEKTQVNEFLNLPKQIQPMIELTTAGLFGTEVDSLMYKRLTLKEQYENEMINPNTNKLNLSGPRLGATFFSPQSYSLLSTPVTEGGYDARTPVMFMFGYQFELQYINSGKLQALFEIIPSITGIDQGIFLPSLTVLNGLRHNIGGWEFAIGPTFGLVRKAKGYYLDNNWHLESDWTENYPIPYPVTEKLDSRGIISLNTGFVFAIGKSFKSGRMNIPVNMFFIPSKYGWRAGLSFGYNAKNKK